MTGVLSSRSSGQSGFSIQQNVLSKSQITVIFDRFIITHILDFLSPTTTTFVKNKPISNRSISGITWICSISRINRICHASCTKMKYISRSKPIYRPKNHKKQLHLFFFCHQNLKRHKKQLV